MRKRMVLAAALCVVAWLSVAGSLGQTPSNTPKAAPVDEYAIHADGGIVYDPLRREAEKTGQLARFSKATETIRELQLGKCRLRVRAPRSAGAYDVIPVAYELTWDAAARPSFPIAVEATAFEDEPRRKGRDLFDLALPGKIDLDVEYLGSVSAHLRPGERHNMKADLSDTPSRYPPFDCSPLVRSGVVEAGDLVWFKVRFTNTGNTILDSEGFGGCLIFPQLLSKKANGEYEAIGTPYNLYYRDLEYLYPGESHEMWLQLCSNMPGFSEGQGKSGTPQGFGIAPGDYKLEFRVFFRCYKTPDVFLNIWEGPMAFAWEMPFSVEAHPRDAAVLPGEKTSTQGKDPDNITRFIHTFEEFMTAFDCHQAPPAEGKSTLNGTLHLQVAPWTKHVVVKLIGTGPVSITSMAIPIEIDDGPLDVAFNPHPPACMIRNGLREPIIASQSMADMRTNIQIGPFPEKHIRERLREMMDCGINVLSTTAMSWLYEDMRQPKSNYQGDALKYVLDIARLEGIPVNGWGSYPFDNSGIQPVAAWIAGQPAQAGTRPDSHANPTLAEANAAVWLYQFQRWGDLYLQLENGQVPIDVEDTRGWMRQDVNVRLPMGEAVVRAFREWVRREYGTIDKANAAWGTSFSSFDQIDPEKDQVPNQFGHIWEYTRQEHPFHDWNQAVADLDAFRTQFRVTNYEDTLAVVRKQIPEAVICLRTEGGNILAGGIDPESPNAHFRHIYYSQRRGALIAEILQKSGIVKLHSDYITVPYTPSELRLLVRTAVRQGIIPAYFPQFDNMRDIAINASYGSEYQVHYNLPEPRKGYMMHCLTAVYPWFKAIYEEGGIPGILWEDYQCDGFVTETQKRELHLFRDKLRAALNTPQAMRDRAAEVKQPSQEWRKGTRASWSYRMGTVPAASRPSQAQF